MSEEQGAKEKPLLMSEAQTAKYAGVSLTALRRHKAAGKIHPVEQFNGLLTIYDAAAVKAYFDGNEEFRAHQARLRRVMSMA